MRNEELKPCPFCGSNELYFGCEFNNPNPERHYVWTNSETGIIVK